MARYKDAKCRLCRREKVKLFLKGERCYSPKCPIEKKGALPPGQHGPKGSRRSSDFSRQLREKQKVKRYYGVLEKQFRRYFQQASKEKGRAGKKLIQLLESRLDNVVYRLGFAPSRSVARQLVNHGHVLVDSRKVDVVSYQVRPHQTITLKPESLKNDQVKKSLADKDRKIPDWLKRKAVVGQFARLPKRDEIDLDIDESLIVEYYSR